MKTLIAVAALVFFPGPLSAANKAWSFAGEEKTEKAGEVIPLEYFEKFISKYGGPMCLVVGDGKHQFMERGVLYTKAPSGYQKLKDGVYVAYDLAGSFFAVPLQDNPKGQVGSCCGGCTPQKNCQDAGCPSKGGPGCSCQPTWKQAVPPAPTTQRTPVGHTHTCARGHTWDHSMTSSHNCPVCGLYQNIQDPAPRMVTSTAPTTYSAPAVTYSLPGTSVIQGGCVGGNCSVPTRSGIFNRR